MGGNNFSGTYILDYYVDYSSDGINWINKTTKNLNTNVDYTEYVDSLFYSGEKFRFVRITVRTNEISGSNRSKAAFLYNFSIFI